MVKCLVIFVSLSYFAVLHHNIYFRYKKVWTEWSSLCRDYHRMQQSCLSGGKALPRNQLTAPEQAAKAARVDTVFWM